MTRYLYDIVPSPWPERAALIDGWFPVREDPSVGFFDAVLLNTQSGPVIHVQSFVDFVRRLAWARRPLPAVPGSREPACAVPEVARG